MTGADATTVFAGLDARADAQLPDWYAATKDDPDVTSFAEAIRALPRAVETTVGYRNPYTEEWVETERFNAIVEPDRLVEQADGEDVDPLFHVPTSSYAVINPVDVYGPLEEVIGETTHDGHALGDVVFGEIRHHRGGGEVHMDVLFDGLSVDLPGRADPITLGVTSGYDFFGGHAVYVEGFARDSFCANSIRSLTDREVVKHVGDVSDFGTWWEEILEQLDLVANDLLAFIVDAQEITLDVRTAPFGLEEFYSLLGLPDYLAERAAADARASASDPFEPDMWTLHSGATYALTHFFTGKEGSTLDGYVRRANDILFNPQAVLERVERTYREQAEQATNEDGQTGVESQVALAQIERVGDDIREKATTFEEREAALRERLDAIPD